MDPFNLCKIVSWNLHRLSTINAICTLQDISRNVGASVFLLQETGSWDSDQVEGATGWRLFPFKSGHRDVAVMLCKDLVNWVPWWDQCFYGIAVFVKTPGSEERGVSKGVLYVTAHLPDRSSSDEEYEEALKCLDDLLRKLPSKFQAAHIFFGVDANVELNANSPVEPQ